MLDFSRLPRDELEAMMNAAEEVVNCMRVLAKTDDNIVGELLKGEDTFYEWNHYPSGDIFDPTTHSQFYYHSHRSGEHGHFHTFLRPNGMPSHCKPAPLPDYEPPEDEDDGLSHLVGISMNNHGVPVRLFTTNRWLTGEIWHSADDVCAMLDHFEIDLAWPSWPVNRWIGAMLQLFRPQIVDLLHERDAIIAEMAKERPDENIYEDRECELISQRPISIDDQIRKIVGALHALR